MRSRPGVPLYATAHCRNNRFTRLRTSASAVSSRASIRNRSRSGSSAKAFWNLEPAFWIKASSITNARIWRCAFPYFLSLSVLVMNVMSKNAQLLPQCTCCFGRTSRLDPYNLNKINNTTNILSLSELGLGLTKALLTFSSYCSLVNRSTCTVTAEKGFAYR